MCVCEWRGGGGGGGEGRSQFLKIGKRPRFVFL